jgi:hypothetical protein
MKPDELREVMARMDGIWPPRKPLTHEERAEWVRFLKPLDGPVALRAIDALRESVMWRPSMAQFRSGYWEAAAEPDDETLALPAAPGEIKPELSDIYGHRREEWIYCWRCDQAISIDDQFENVIYDERRGMAHHKCPREGSAPHMPTKDTLERQERWRKFKISKED